MRDPAEAARRRRGGKPGRLPTRLPTRLLARVGLLCSLAFAQAAVADGGHIALHATGGGYTVTLFTAPTPLVTGPADLTLLVQDAATGEVLGDAVATVRLSGEQGELELPMARRAGGNPLLLGASPLLRTPGSYRLVLRAGRRGGAVASFRTVLQVDQDHRRRTTLLFGLLLPLVAVLLFLVNQGAKRQAWLRSHPPAPLRR